MREAGYVFGCTQRVYTDLEPLRANVKFQQLMKEGEARARKNERLRLPRFGGQKHPP